MRSPGSVVPAVLLILGCGGGGPAPAPASSTLPPGAAARAGSQLVSASTITRIAAAQGLTPRAALDLALADALLAEGARASVSFSSASSIERAASARALLEQFSREAAQVGPPSEAELAEVTRERWVDVDRPAGARVTHAVVLNDKPESDAAARAVADKLALAVQGATTPEELIELAKTVPAEPFKIRAESLPFVTTDGRIFQRTENGFKPRPGSFDPDFARGANALSTPGQLSPVIKSSFGYHVIRLDELAPSAVIPRRDLPAVLGPEVVARRAGRSRQELLEKLHAAAPVQLDRAVEDLMGQVKIQ